MKQVIAIESMVRILSISMAYLLVLPFQLVIFPSNYFSVRDIIFSRNAKKALGAAASRFVFVFFLSWICHALTCTSKEILWGFGIGSFLCAWPSIYHYQLFIFHKHAIKFWYFISCLASVMYAVICAWFAADTLIPMLTKGKEFFLLDNSAFNFIIQIIGLCIPLGIRKILEDTETSNPYMDCATFSADLIMTQRKMWFEQKFCDQYSYEISKAADKYMIDDKLLETILLLERINRKSWYMQLAERFVCKYFPQIAINQDMSLGIAQISVSIAKKYYQQAPTRFLKRMLRPEESIELCAFYLRELIDIYTKRGWENSDEWIEGVCEVDEEHKMSLFIASHYVCGCNLSLRKFALVYMTLIAPLHPLKNPGGNG